MPPPEELPPPAPATEEPEDSTVLDEPGSLWKRRRFLIAGLAALLLLTAIVAVVLALTLGDTTVYPAAADGDSLVVLSPFVNYTSGGQGFKRSGATQSSYRQRGSRGGPDSR